jgi:serine/threonine-protein kinase
MRLQAFWTTMTLLIATASSRADTELSQQAQAILKKCCERCHGVGSTNEGGINYILDVPTLLAKKSVVAGQPQASLLLKKIIRHEMPPEGEEPQPSRSEIALLEQWIAEGAKPFVSADAARRRFLATRDVQQSLRDHLAALPARERTHRRYFTLTHVHNNPSATDAQLRLYRAALSKLINSLSWRSSIVRPEPIDEAGTILSIGLRDLSWDQETWLEILRHYPYGLAHDQDPDPVVQRLAAEVVGFCGTDLPAVRVDWFVAVASRPPLYHALLELPEHAGELEKQLKVDVTANFLEDRLARAGFATSGVSGQNRLVERHDALYGAYWKSYDFKSNEGQGNLFRLPLGPAFAANPFPRQAFIHDGGEILFHLPNGLQAYLLVDGQDRRIDEGPIEVVSDSLKTSGTAKIVNGLSCLACHAQGMKTEFKDTVREGTALEGRLREKVQRVYGTSEEMSRLVQSDMARFLPALEKAIGPFVRIGADAPKDIRDFPEPIGLVARQYLLKELTIEDAALELGLADREGLRVAIQHNPRLAALGLRPLATGATIKRETWESRDRFVSPLQEAASALDLGVPKVVQ